MHWFLLFLFICASVCVCLQDDEFVARDDFEDADQLRIGNDGIFILTFFSKHAVCSNSPTPCSRTSLRPEHPVLEPPCVLNTLF